MTRCPMSPRLVRATSLLASCLFALCLFAPGALALGGEEGHVPDPSAAATSATAAGPDCADCGGEEGHHPIDGLGGEEGHRPIGLASGGGDGALQLAMMTASDEALAGLHDLGLAGGALTPQAGHPGAGSSGVALDCADTGFAGACWGDVLAFCDPDGVVQIDDCAAADQGCGFSQVDGWYDCLDHDAGPAVDASAAQLAQWSDLDVLGDGDGETSGCSGGEPTSGLPAAAAVLVLVLGLRRRTRAAYR